MKVHSTNYANAFIQVAPDCAAVTGTVPSKSGTVAALQYVLIAKAPYQLTSDDLLLAVTARRKNVPADDELRMMLFSKGQPCLRASPLVKTYGWGVHHDAEGKVALFGCETSAYRAMCDDPALRQVVGMRSRRA